MRKKKKKEREEGIGKEELSRPVFCGASVASSRWEHDPSPDVSPDAGTRKT